MSAPASPALNSRPDPGAIARALLGLALIGASVALAIEQLSGTWARAFVTGNALPHQGRNALLGAMLASALVGGGVGLVLLRLGRGAGPQHLGRVARAAAPVALAGLVPGLLAMDAWSDTLVLSLSLAAFLLAAEPLFRLSFGAQREIALLGATTSPGKTRAAIASLVARGRAAIDRLPPALRRNGPPATVAVAVLVYVAYMAFFTVRNHYKFNTYNWDLGHLDNEFWNALHGRPFRNTLIFREGNWANIRNHFQPAIYALLPLYAAFPRAEGLLCMQAAIIGAGAIPVYRFAARRLPRALAMLLAMAYLLYPPTHGAQFFDFHFQPIAATFLLVAIDCLDARRMRPFWVFFALALACREDISAGAAMIGLVLVLAGRRSPYPFRVSAAIFGISVGYFAAVRFALMPAVGAWGFADLYKLLSPEGEHNFGGIIKTLLTNPLYTFRTLLVPNKLRYALQILIPLAFLPLRRWHLALLLIPGAFFTLLTTEYIATLEIYFQYASIFVPFIFPATALALVALEQGTDGLVRRRAATATLVLGTLFATAAWGAIPPRQTLRSSYGWTNFEPPTAEERQRRLDLEELGRMVPMTAILATSDREIPHLSNRYDCWNLAAGFEGSDYVLYTTVNAISPDLENGAAAERAGYVRVAVRPGLILLKRPGAP